VLVKRQGREADHIRFRGVFLRQGTVIGCHESTYGKGIQQRKRISYWFLLSLSLSFNLALFYWNIGLADLLNHKRTGVGICSDFGET
jgi:hypothetical protein